jgi:hypothetical protein
MKTRGCALVVLVALFGGLLVPSATAASHSAGMAVSLKGSINGAGSRQMSLPDTGAAYLWTGTGSVAPLGAVAGKGTNRGVGFIRAGNPTGTATLTGAHGSINLKITFGQTAGFAPLPVHGIYTITGGSGRYAGAHGSGSITRHQGTCAGQCPTGTTYTETYRFGPTTPSRSRK